MEKEILEKLLKIIDLNKSKKEIINNMYNLELNNKFYSEEYINLVDLYKRLSDNLNNVLACLDEKEKLVINNRICKLNAILYRPITLNDLIYQEEDKHIEFRRIITDLGTELMNIYQESYNKMAKNQIVALCSMLGVELAVEGEEEDINVKKVNECMVSDFTNVYYSEISKKLKKEDINLDTKKELLKLKYNLLYSVPNLEERAIENKFSITDIPRLASIDTIYETGIQSKDYLNYLDIVMVGLLENTIKASLYTTNFRSQLVTLDELLLIKTYASILDDYELIDCMEIDINVTHNIKYTLCSELIKKELAESKETAKNNYKIRKYGIIEKESL